MAEPKPLFKAPYDIKDVSALFAIVAFILIIAAIIGNNLFGLFQQNVNFGWTNYFWKHIPNSFFKNNLLSTNSIKQKQNIQTIK